MGNLTEHVMLNKWDNDINDAIVAVGGDTSGSSGLPDYASIIRNQLVAKGISPTPEAGKELILEGDSCIIEADENGRDHFNTEYAVGIKTGLIPGTLYLRLCTAVKDIEPVYIDLTRVSGGEIMDIDVIINELLNSQSFINAVKDETVQEVTQEVTVLQENIEVVQNQILEIQDAKVDNTIYEQDQITLNTKIESKVDEEEVKIIVNNIIEENAGDNDGINVEELNWE